MRLCQIDVLKVLYNNYSYKHQTGIKQGRYLENSAFRMSASKCELGREVFYFFCS